MCYNTEMASKAEILDRQEALDYADHLSRLDSVDPGRWTRVFGRPQALILADGGVVHQARWTFLGPKVTSEAQADKFCTLTGNCRAEEMFSKSTFKEAARERRGLLAVRGYYEPQHRGSKIQWFRFFRPSQEIFFLGTVWQMWNGTPTFAVCTMPPGRLASWIHNNPDAFDGSRQPVVFRSKDEMTAWTRGGEPSSVSGLLEVREDGFLVAQACANVNGKLPPKPLPEPPGRPEGVLPGYLGGLDDAQQGLF